ncbi:hypothetical protein PO909_021046 [Leuciscus waleckii]
MDPHYSVIVSKECLFNVSCVPEADSDTVVKISGRVSEDGQTVSGLKAVLETNQENHQIYQVMNQPDSVPLDQTPQRPVDHSTQYDHQQILIMQDDPTVRKAAASLYEKRPTVTSVYALDKNQRPELIHGASVPLSEDSRLTLVGHGERDSSGETRLAGYTAQDVAKIIQHTFRTGDRIKTTSVVACEVGSDKEFAETLLRELHETANIETELHLRNAVLQLDEAMYTTYFTASVIAESARNFRTFPLILMAVKMVEKARKEGEDFLYEEHSMARGDEVCDADSP